jgi:glycine cleavage system regulatory protein
MNVTVVMNSASPSNEIARAIRHLGFARILVCRDELRLSWLATLLALILLIAGSAANATTDAQTRIPALDMFKQLVEINATESAATAMQSWPPR